jgi:ubiquinone/menaquinone biosynthesis C-methylase UbiE
VGIEIDLLSNYPRARRNINERAEKKSEEVQRVAREFGFDYFDGDRTYGYGGFNYHPKFWGSVVKDIARFYNLDNTSSILDVGCGKGFMLFDFKRIFPNLVTRGIDVSEYAISNSKPEIRDCLSIGNAKSLPFPDKSFDLVISINTIHNLEEFECAQALKEIERVTKKNAFVVVDAFINDEEKKRMFDWNLTALTIKSIEDWKRFFSESGYTHDYYWFKP